MAFSLKKYCRNPAAFTLIDNIVAVAIVAGFFGALYAMSGQCLYLLNSGRQTTVAQQAIQDRIEQLRNIKWVQLTDPAYIAGNVLNTAAQNGASLSGLSETVTVNAYPTALSPSNQVTRSSAGAVTVSSTNSAIASGDLVRIDVTLNWTASPGNRPRSVSTTTVWAVNTR